MEEQIRKTLWKHAKPYIDEGYVIKVVNLDTKEYEVAKDLVKLYNLHFVSKRSELLIGLLTMLEKESGDEFIDKAEIVAKYEANL